jgi:hypothetical protein
MESLSQTAGHFLNSLNEIDEVLLFSGGLDSLGGVVVEAV